MKLDPATLENVVMKGNGSYTARCPACAEDGHDKDGNHLIVYPDGKFGCAKTQNDKAHNRRIRALAGDFRAATPPQITVSRLVVPESAVVMEIGRLGRPNQTRQEKPIAEAETTDSQWQESHDEITDHETEEVGAAA